MPLRPLTRHQAWLLPPSLDDLVPEDHPARFTGAFVDALAPDDWAEVGVPADGAVEGAPAYHPRLLLAVWLYGFMTGVRSSRKLETACRDQLPFLWLTGCQRPDHNTLWRFYQEHRQGMRKLLKRTVRIAVKLGLVDLALQAVDGTRVGGSAARERSLNAEQLAALLERTDAAIADLEAQNTGGDEGGPVRLPAALRQARVLKEQVTAAQALVKAEGGPERVNLTDPEAVLVKTRQGVVAGYTGEAMVSALDEGTAGVRGLLVTAAEAAAQAHDYDQLLPMLEAAETNLGQRAAVSLADGGYHSGDNLRACEERGETVLLPEAQGRRLDRPYHKDRFVYDAAADTYTCPEGKPLRFRGERVRKGQEGVRVYRAGAVVCRACPLFGACTKDTRQGRAIEIGPDEEVLRRHRAVMGTERARELYRRRKVLPEPVFGMLKEQMGLRRWLLRGLTGVQAEWSLVATAFNLRTLWRVGRGWGTERRALLAG